MLSNIETLNYKINGLIFTPPYIYENRYKTELQKFAAMQVGRRRRDDYTDGTIRIPIESPPQ